MAIVTTNNQNYTNIANAIRQKSGNSAQLKPNQMGAAILAIPTGATINNQNKEVAPTESQQQVTYDSGYTGLGTVTVDAVSSTYVGSDVARRQAATITPGTTDQTIAANTYLTGAQTISGDADLVAGNIKSGVDIFGVTGNYSGVDVSNTTAVAGDVKVGKIFYNSSEVQTTGTLDLKYGVIRPDAEKVATLSSDVKWIEDLELTIPAYSTSSQTLRAATAFETTVNLNMSTYNYFVVERMLTIPSYSIATDAKGKQEYLLCSALYEIVNFPGGTFSTLSGNKSYATQQNTLYTVGNAARIVYWSSNTAITAGTSAAYGCSTTVSAPTISSTNTTSPVLTIMFPALIMRGHASYLSSTYWGAITDVRTQFIADVYRIPKDSTWGIDGWGEQSQIMHILDCIDTTNHTLT